MNSLSNSPPSSHQSREISRLKNSEHFVASLTENPTSPRARRRTERLISDDLVAAPTSSQIEAPLTASGEAPKKRGRKKGQKNCPLIMAKRRKLAEKKAKLAINSTKETKKNHQATSNGTVNQIKSKSENKKEVSKEKNKAEDVRMESEESDIEVEVEEEKTKSKKIRWVKMTSIFSGEEGIPSRREQERAIGKMKSVLEEVKEEYNELLTHEISGRYLDFLNDGKEVVRCLPEQKKLSKFFFQPISKNRVSGHTFIYCKKPTIDESYADRPKFLSKLKVAQIRLDGNDVRPPMNNWVPIEMSIKINDQLRLSHMPYFDDKECNDEPFFQKLEGHFPDGVHGFSKNYFECNDWLLYKVMRAALENHSGNPDLLYYSLYRLWPNKMSQRELTTQFPLLCARFAESGFDSNALEPWVPKREQKVAQKILNNECHSCLEYSCQYHGFMTEQHADFFDGEFFPVKIPLMNPSDNAFCSNDCWKKEDSNEFNEKLQVSEEDKKNYQTNAFISKAKLTALTDSQGSAAVFALKMDSEKTFCEAAEMLDIDDLDAKVRTCRQVYELVVSLSERPSALRILTSKQSKLKSQQERSMNFRRGQHNQERMKRKCLEEKLQERAEQEGRPLKDLVAEEMQKNERKNGDVALVLETPLVSCRHEGPCGKSDDCVCRQNGICSHLCKCDVNCPQRFIGCNCAAGQCSTKACPCNRAGWECIPATCKSCQCDNLDFSSNGCLNYKITRMAQKQVCVAPSKVSGNGLFLLEDVEKDEFIIEYVGERISDEEAERRGAIYDRYKCSYMFDTKTDGAIDSFRVGNLSRFANHDDQAPTCYAQTVVVNGEQRIGIYANKKLAINDELTFNYAYSGEHQKIFKKRGKK